MREAMECYGNPSSLHAKGFDSSKMIAEARNKGLLRTEGKEYVMKDGDVVLLENTRYRAEETKNGEAFSKELASLCDVFVNDAFGTAHRAHCSNVGVTEYVDTAAVGYLMQKEIDFLGNAVNNPVRPFVAILGGSKVSSKISVINNLLDKVDTLIIGGGMAYTFMKAMGEEVGKSLLEEDYLDYAKEMMAKAEKNGVKLLIPIDTVVAKEFSNDVPFRTVGRGEIAADEEGLDIGEKTRELFADAAKAAKTDASGLIKKIESLQEEVKNVQSENEKLKAKLANQSLGDVMDNVVDVKGVKLLAAKLPEIDMNGLRNLGDQLIAKLGEGVVVLVSAKDGKVSLVVMASNEAMGKGAHAGNLVKELAVLVGGGGGGRPNMAQAGGKNPDGIDAVLAKASESLAGQIK